MITPSWNSLEAEHFNDAYKLLCHALFVGEKVGNTRELRNIQFTVKDVSDAYISVRNPSVKYMLGELIWYLAGSRETAFISRFAPFWNTISDNGITSNSAYGFLINNRYEFNQLYTIVELLKQDPASRRAVINLNYANANVIRTKDEPCTIALQFYIRENKVHCTGMMRSNDIWRGLPYDIVYFTLLQTIIAKALGKEVGSYTHFATSLHMYDRDNEKIRKCLEPSRQLKKFKLNYEELFASARYLYEVVNNENIVNICKHRGIIEFTGEY